MSKHIEVSFKAGEANRFGLANIEDVSKLRAQLLECFKAGGWVVQDFNVKLVDK